MKRILFALAIITFLTLTITCQQSKEVASEPEEDVQADIQAIKDIVKELESALNAGDSDRYLRFYADNIVEIYPNEPAYNGKEAIRNRDKEMFGEMTLHDAYTVPEVMVRDDLAVAHFTWSTTVEFKASGKTDSTKGNWIMVFQKQSNGAWNVIYSIWSDEGLVRPDQPAVFPSPATSGDADPLIGTWKLNVAKSKYPPNQPVPKELTETYQEINGGLIDFTYESVQADGTQELFKATWPAEGGMVDISEGQANPGRSYAETLIEPGNWYVTVLQDGKQIATMHKVISQNGKTMTQTSTDVDKDGNPSVILRVYEKH